MDLEHICHILVHANFACFLPIFIVWSLLILQHEAALATQNESLSLWLLSCSVLGHRNAWHATVEQAYCQDFVVLGLKFLNDVDAIVVNLQELARVFLIVSGHDVVVVINPAELYGVRHGEVRPNVGLAQLVS